MHLAKGATEDADQRITQDVTKLSSDMAGLVTGMVKPFVDIVWYVLKQDMPSVLIIDLVISDSPQAPQFLQDPNSFTT